MITEVSPSHGTTRQVQPVRALLSTGEAVKRFRDQRVVTVAAGTTCAYLGDERNLREFLVADEVVRQLRQEGHLVHFLLFDDNLDGLTFRQLRVAVDKDPEMIERWQPYCGMPISSIPDPWAKQSSFAAHFESVFLDRLAHLGCHPTLIGTSRLYEQGAYRPYVHTVFVRYAEILDYLHAEFPNYTPQQLFFPICPDCGHIDTTRILEYGHEVVFDCSRCEKRFTAASDEIRGKLSWKLDHAAKWSMYNVDVEPFSLAYLEPQEGSYVIARALGNEFFGGRAPMPLRYGLVSMNKELGGKLLSSLPANVVRSIMTERWKTEVEITPDRVRLEASRHEVLPGVTYADAARQLVPTWHAMPEALTAAERELVALGVAYHQNFLAGGLEIRFPARETVLAERPETLCAASRLLRDLNAARRRAGNDYEAFDGAAKSLIAGFGSESKAVVACVRKLVGQETGIPTRKLLFHLPVAYLELVQFIVELASRSPIPPTPASQPSPADQAIAWVPSVPAAATVAL